MYPLYRDARFAVGRRERARERALRLRLALVDDFEDFAETRLGSFLRFTLAMRSSSSSLIDSTICFDAPRRRDLGVSPRFAESAAPAAFCCCFDLAGMLPPGGQKRCLTQKQRLMLSEVPLNARVAVSMRYCGAPLRQTSDSPNAMGVSRQLRPGLQ
jgi:hypothetical protein